MAGGYSRTRKGPRADLPGVSPRSGLEANLLRILNYLIEDREQVLKWEYEKFITLIFPGKSGKPTGNQKYNPDVFLASRGSIYELLLTGEASTHEVQFAFVEGKGRLKKGGWFEAVEDFSSLDKAHDSDSRLRFDRAQRYYPMVTRRLLILGASDWSLIEKRWKKIIPHWE